MSKKNDGRIKLGYALFINSLDIRGDWKRVGFLFNSSYEASEYRERYYPNVKKWSINAIRLNNSPLTHERK